jgi:hypothetical protein
MTRRELCFGFHMIEAKLSDRLDEELRNKRPHRANGIAIFKPRNCGTPFRIFIWECEMAKPGKFEMIF